MLLYPLAKLEWVVNRIFRLLEDQIPHQEPLVASKTMDLVSNYPSKVRYHEK